MGGTTNAKYVKDHTDFRPPAECRRCGEGHFVIQRTCLHNQRGRAAAVMVSMQVYEESQHEIDLLRLLARGEKEIEAGLGYDLEEVLKEADRFLESSKP